MLKLLDAAWFSPLMNSLPEKKRGNRFFFVPFSVPKDTPQKSKNDGMLRLLMVGKYEERRKNHELFLRAFSCLQRKNLEAWIVGQCSSVESARRVTYLKNFSASLQIENRVTFFANVKPDQMQDMYRSCDLFVLPARHEPAAISVLEALSFGLPVICTKTCGTKTYIKNGHNGLVLSAENAELLASLIDQLIQDPKTLARYKEGAANSADSFTAFVCLKKFSDLTEVTWGIPLL